MPNRLTVTIPEDLWYKLVDIQSFKQKQILSSVSMSDIIMEILKNQIEHSSYYQGILSGKFTPEEERSPLMKKRLEEQKEANHP